MEENQIVELQNYLLGLGFEGSKFHEALRQKINFDTPNFTLQHSIDFGEERMSFTLNFAKDRQFNSYRLEKFKATHRSPVIIEHTTINGINTAALEESMKGKDWQSYFNRNKDQPISDAVKEMQDITQQLNKLTEDENFDGIEIQEELMYKYWPAENYYSNGKSEFKEYHERSRDFEATEWGICNAKLAYNTVSGRLDGLFEKLQHLDLDSWPEGDLYRKLEQILSKETGNFKLGFRRSTPEGYSEISIPVEIIESDYSLDSYEFTFTPYPAINHGKFNGVDSKELEDSMRDVDWNNDRKLFIIINDDEPEFLPKISEIFERINTLAQDPEGSIVSDKLQLKYWVDATFVDSLIPQSAWEYLDNLPKIKNEFPIELNAKAAYNLLCGRAIPEHLMFPVKPESDTWIRLNLNNENAISVIEYINGFNKTDLEDALSTFPIPNSNYYQVRNSLLRGDLATVNLQNDRKVLMECNPENRSVNIYTPDLRPIPINTHLDPDWKPSVQKQNQGKQTQHRPIPTHKNFRTTNHHPKRKGKGL